MMLSEPTESEYLDNKPQSPIETNTNANAEKTKLPRYAKYGSTTLDKCSKDKHVHYQSEDLMLQAWTLYKPGPFLGGAITPPLPGIGGEMEVPVRAAAFLYALRVAAPSKF
jgi:hypothetical protein